MRPPHLLSFQENLTVMAEKRDLIRQRRLTKPMYTNQHRQPLFTHEGEGVEVRDLVAAQMKTSKCETQAMEVPCLAKKMLLAPSLPDENPLLAFGARGDMGQAAATKKTLPQSADISQRHRGALVA